MISDTDFKQSLIRAHLALTGLAIGDAIGAFFEFSRGKPSHFITSRKLPEGIWHWTDDTQMALSIFAVLRQCAKVDQDFLAASLAYRYEKSRGYGMTTRAILKRIRRNKTWHDQAGIIFRGEGSFGNGGASRVSPVGAYFADNISEVINQAKLSAEVTHAHPESIAGTIAVAVATALAWQLRSENEISRQIFLDQIISGVPQSNIREKLIMARDLENDEPINQAALLLGNGKNATVQTTVPFALWCASDLKNDFVNVIWQTLEGQGDCDTICSIVGGITAMRVGTEGIPLAWRQACEPIPQWVFDETILSLAELPE
jgi:ADP-ribosylglycohydrolase